jgi:hypothetical protein
MEAALGSVSDKLNICFELLAVDMAMVAHRLMWQNFHVCMHYGGIHLHGSCHRCQWPFDSQIAKISIYGVG